MVAQVGAPVQKLLPILFQLFLLVALGASSAAADRKERKAEPLPAPPPQPVEQTVKVRRGETLAIPLRIYGSQRESLRFLIRKEPASGKLSDVQPRGREVAIVTYSSPADLAIVRDQFSYAVQNSAGVSASVDVVINIVDEPPVLLLPDVMTFPAVLAGRSSTQEIEITNGGGGMASGELKVDPPWQIEGSAEYKLGAGEMQKVKLVFAPKAAGPFRGELKFSSDRGRAVGLKGEASAALAAAPPTVVLQSHSGEILRTGAFELINGTEEPQTVTFSENPALKLPKTVELLANGRVVVPIMTTPELVGPITEEIVAKGAGVELRVAVNGPAAGPVLRRLGEQLDFGTVAPKNGGTATIEVQNIGGAEGYWRWESIPPFSPAEEGVRLAPGEKRTLMVRLDPGAFGGQYRAGLKLVGEQQTVEVMAEALTSAAPVAKARSSSASKLMPVATSNGTRASSRAVQQNSETPVAGNVPLPSKIQVLEPTRAVVLWPSRYYKGSYRLEARSLGLGPDRKLQTSWKELPSAKVRTDGKLIIAEIEGLQPDSVQAYRLVNIPPGADEGRPIAMVQFKTPVQEPLIRFTLLRGLFLLLAVCLGLMVWHRFKRS